MELTKENVALLAACGVLIGTIISNAITYLIHRSKQHHDWVKENKKKKIEKGEELYKNFVIWKKSVFSIHSDWVLLVRGHISLDSLNDKIIKRDIDNPEFGKISEVSSILAGIYFPELLTEVKAAQEVLKPANNIYFSILRGEVIKDKQLAVETILGAGQGFDLYIDSILEELSLKISEMMEK